MRIDGASPKPYNRIQMRKTCRSGGMGTVHVVALVRKCAKEEEREEDAIGTQGAWQHLQAGRRGRGMKARDCATARDGQGLDAYRTDGVVAVERSLFASGGEVGDVAACVGVSTRR